MTMTPSSPTIRQAMIMCAGFAKRMRPLTDHLPKPLLQVYGKPLLTHIIDHLLVEGVTRIIVNGHHAIHPLKDYVAWAKETYPQCEFILSIEDDILETGGGLMHAMPHIDQSEPFYMINGDAFWVNAPDQTTLSALRDYHIHKNATLTLLLQSCASMDMTQPVGDYDIDDHGLATLCPKRDGKYMFTGIRICNPSILSPYKVENFSFLQVMNDQQNAQNLMAIDHKGQWYHLSTPEDLDEVNKATAA